MTVRIGTRTSSLAMWQANKVSKILESNGLETQIVGIKSKGDKSLGGNLASSVGQFIHAVDSKLLENEIDIAVHSSKDVPVNIVNEISNLAYLERGCTNDLLIFSGDKNHLNLRDIFNSKDQMSIDKALEMIPKSGMIGTVSGRRQSFLLSKRPDIIPIAVRGQVETRLRRLNEGRVDAIILAEIGLKRLHEIGALDPWILQLNAIRISERDWPTAPGQGALSVHCLTKNFDKFSNIRSMLNHDKTEKDVTEERNILSSIGGGCLYPAGIKIDGSNASVKISPKNWRDMFSRGLPFKNVTYYGELSEFKSPLPIKDDLEIIKSSDGPKLISTLNSDRLATVLQNDGINVVNKPVIELVAKPDLWPENFIDDNVSRSDWPYLVLTSPFAAKCAIEVSRENSDLNRIQWLAIGEGTARACFLRGVTVSICAKARDSSELIEYIDKNIGRNIRLMIPRSNVANNDLVEGLNQLGFSIESWVGYENRSKSVQQINVEPDDVLLLSSPSSARAWVENSLPIPKSILCMGKSSLEEINSLGYFSESTVEILNGPTAEFVSKWWKNKER